MSVWCVYKGKMSWWRDLNSWPLPYQGSALPLSYISIQKKSGRRGSNSRHSAWKADALPTELLPQKKYKYYVHFSGENRIRTCEGITSRFTVCPRWPLEYLPRIFELLKYVLFLSRQRDSNPRPRDYKSRALANWAMPASIFLQSAKV